MDDGQLGILPGTTDAVDASSAWPIAGSTGIASGSGTGQHGVSPMTGTIATTAGDAATGVWDWLNKPFTHPMAPLSIFMLVGVVLIAAVVWNLILYHVRIAAEAI
jgi:hypothetical protein